MQVLRWILCHEDINQKSVQNAKEKGHCLTGGVQRLQNRNLKCFCIRWQKMKRLHHCVGDDHQRYLSNYNQNKAIILVIRHENEPDKRHEGNANAKGRWLDDYLKDGKKRNFAPDTFAKLYKKNAGL